MTDKAEHLPANDVVLRRLPPEYLKPNELGDGLRMTSNAFVDNDEDGVSVYSVERLGRLKLVPDDVVAAFGSDWAYAAVAVQELINEGFFVEVSPDPDDAALGSAHALIKRNAPGGSKALRRLAKRTAKLHLRDGE